MDELGYVYHRGAATLRTQKSSVVGLIITDISNPFFSMMALGVERSLSDAGYLTVLMNTFDDTDRFNQLVRTMFEYPVAAVMYVPVAGADMSFTINGNGPAISSLAVTREPTSDVPFLGPDDHLGGRLAATHLIEVHNRERLVYLGGPEWAGPRSRRLEGVRDAIRSHPRAQIVKQLPGTTSLKCGTALAEQLLQSNVSFDAVLCHSDVIAFALCRAFRRRGISVPQCVSVVGFDGLDQDEVFEPTITSISADPVTMGHLAADWVVAAMDGKEPEPRLLVKPLLQKRASCGCGVD